MRKEYKLTGAQKQKLLEACKPVPYIIVGGYPPPSQQERANDAWKSLGREMGFVWDSVRPVDGKCSEVFTAEQSAAKREEDEEC